MCVYAQHKHMHTSLENEEQHGLEGPGFATTAHSKNIYCNHTRQRYAEGTTELAHEMEIHFTVINEQCPMACGKVSFTAE